MSRPAFRSIRLSKISLRIFRLAVRRESHDFVFAGIDLEAGVIGKRRIEQAEGVREMYLLSNREISAAPNAAEVVAHSPTPSMVRTAASSNGEG